tara:strand:+ start:472 stop:681 length:210 start_codon:yes stop_codon:yes gene_type:complete
MQKIILSDTYKIAMYLMFTLALFFSIGVRLSHGGIFGEMIVPGAIKFGEILILMATIMWLGIKVTEHQR